MVGNGPFAETAQCLGVRYDEIYVDGAWWGSDYSLNHFNPDEVQAIEVYSGPAQVPIQYNTAGSGCGVILIWLRDGSEVVPER